MFKPMKNYVLPISRMCRIISLIQIKMYLQKNIDVKTLSKRGILKNE